MKPQTLQVAPHPPESHLLMSYEDEELLRDVCQDPRSQQIVNNYNDFLVHDIASQRFAREGSSASQAVTGRIIQREMPINAYLIDHGRALEAPEESEYIGQAIEVPFERNIGLKKSQRSGYLAEQARYRKIQADAPKKETAWKKKPSEKEERAKSLTKRKTLYDKYTKVDDSVRARVKQQIEANVSHIKNCRCKQYCEPKKYVIEQINARLVRPKTSEKVKVVQRDACLLRMADMINDIMKMRVPEEPAEKKSATASTAPTAIAEPVKVKEVVKPAAQKKPYEIEETVATIVKQDRYGRSVDRKKRMVKVVERNYELDRQSFEVAELINHVPSRVYSLHSPIEKQLASLEDESIYRFDTDRFSATNKVVVEERVVEYEKRAVHQFKFEGVEIPVIKKKKTIVYK